MKGVLSLNALSEVEENLIGHNKVHLLDKYSTCKWDKSKTLMLQSENTYFLQSKFHMYLIIVIIWNEDEIKGVLSLPRSHCHGYSTHVISSKFNITIKMEWQHK